MVSFAAILLASCASIQPPPGGQEDKTPPEIARVTPNDRTVNVSRETNIHIEFGQAMQKGTLPQALTVSPYVNGSPTYDWSGYDEVDIHFPTPLKENTTYTLTFSKDLKTYRGNALAEPILLTFSTGPIIDTAVLHGLVLPEIADRSTVDTKNTFLFAYNISGIDPDTINYSTTPPDLLSQVDNQGKFQFLSLKQGDRYRVVAVVDQIRDRLYEKASEAYGAPTHDIEVDTSVTTGYAIRLAPAIDTIRPLLVGGTVSDSFHVALRFSDELDSTMISSEFFTASGHRILAAARLHFSDKPNIVDLLFAEPIRSREEIKITVSDEVRDLSKNLIDPASRTTTIIVTGEPHSATRIGIAKSSFRDSLRDVSQTESWQVQLSDAVDTAALRTGLRWTDTSGRTVPFVIRWSDPSRFTLRPADTLRPKLFQTISLFSSSLQSPNTAIGTRDTVYTYHFETGNTDDFGRLSGVITTEFQRLAEGKTVVVDLLNQQGTRLRRRSFRYIDPLPYVFDKIPSGQYRVRAYVTSRADLEYDSGSLLPFRFAEPSGDFPGIVDVRARWAVEKVNFGLR